MTDLKPCPFCGNLVVEKIASGVHFYECRYERCGACISFVGSKSVGRVGRIKMFEADNPKERFNRRNTMGKKVKLKPCPFCGGMAVLNKEKGRIFSYVKCIVCGAESGLIKVSAEYGSEDKAVEAWNRRVDNSGQSEVYD